MLGESSLKFKDPPASFEFRSLLARRPLMQNIELKAIYGDLERGARLARELGARFRGELAQTDTYFHVRFGRLKLREINGASEAELIAYQRDDHARARVSSYEIIPIADAAAARRGLAATLGVRLMVVKRRDLWIWKNVRIHLDRVEHLGNYLEFEAVLDDPSQADGGRRLVGDLVRHFAITPGDVQHHSYADLLMVRSGGAPPST